MFSPIFAAGYAETHYKFRLPWSPLHKPWPEIFLDAPSRVEPRMPWPVWLVLRDANLFPVKIHEIELTISAEGWPLSIQTIGIDTLFAEPFHFFPLNVDLGGRKGNVKVLAKIKASRAGSHIPREFQEWNYPGLAPWPLQVLSQEHPTPKPAGWWAGETHCHTWHSSDPVEFGAPPQVLQQSAKVLGLDYVFCTDHSYDFAFRTDDYRIPANPQLRWQSLKTECAELAPYPLMVPGEEVSCGNSQGRNVHLLVPGFSDFIPGMGDSGRRWFRNHPTLSIAEVMERIGDVPCFAAHPQYPMGLLERMVFRRGPFSSADLHFDREHPICGLEFWNGNRGDGFKAGRNFWIQQLLNGNSILPLGGNDAHGDLNRFTGVKIPLWSLHSSRARIFGKVRTVLKADAPQLSVFNLHESFRRASREASLYVTDGPTITLVAQGNGWIARAFSSPDFGPIDQITLFTGEAGDSIETRRSFTPGSMEWEMCGTAGHKGSYIRVECRSRLGYAALTAALFFA
jgi:hypothetical protein